MQGGGGGRGESESVGVGAGEQLIWSTLSHLQ